MRSAIAVGLEEALETRIEEMREELKAHLALRRRRRRGLFAVGHRLAASRAVSHASLLGEGLDDHHRRRGSDRKRHDLHRARPPLQPLHGKRRDGAQGCADRGLAADSIALPLADATGLKPRADIDVAVLDAIETAIAGGAACCCRSWTPRNSAGARRASACLDEIARRWPGKVQVVVDACQMRLGRGRLRRLSRSRLSWCWSRARSISADRRSAARCWCLAACREAIDAREANVRRDLPTTPAATIGRSAGRRCDPVSEPAQFRAVAALGSGAGRDRRLLRVPDAFRATALGRVSRRRREPDRGCRRRCAWSARQRQMRLMMDDDEFADADDLSVHDRRQMAAGFRRQNAARSTARWPQDLERRDRPQRVRPRSRRAAAA